MISIYHYQDHQRRGGGGGGGGGSSIQNAKRKIESIRIVISTLLVVPSVSIFG